MTVSHSAKLKIRNNVRSFRKKNGETQKDLADAVGVTRQTISKIEKQNHVPDFTLAIHLAFHFKVMVDDLFEADMK
ncbi:MULTISPECIES: helix-turn-helix transcriptional regulator [Paenibacillus]|uniref:helix-turn-helix transcriptional regulator n=1 Tax=Paenibacillus TaxID=44249 RepID=UPI00042178F2|nr:MULTISPECIES: helix-turn-helix transcriptional regulator [Paenibacillus]